MTLSSMEGRVEAVSASFFLDSTYFVPGQLEDFTFIIDVNGTTARILSFVVSGFTQII